MSSVAVFCGSKAGNDPSFARAARELGQTIVDRGLALVYGGGGVGLMGVLADAVLEKGGKVTGVIPEKLYELEVAHSGLTELIRVKDMHERKGLMAELAQGFIALPGGVGTLEEMMEVMTWAQIGYHAKPSGFLNVNGYYDKFISFFDHMNEMGFLYVPMSEQVIIETNASVLLDRMFG